MLIVAIGTDTAGGGANTCFLNSSNTGYIRLKANKIESLSFPPVKTTLPETKINYGYLTAAVVLGIFLIYWIFLK